MTESEIREAIAESGKTRVSEIMSYLNHRHAGKFDKKLARDNAKEIVAEMKDYI